MSREYPETPTLDKMISVAEDSNKIGDFLDWLRDNKKIILCKWHDYRKDEYESLPTGFYQTHETFDSLLHEYFDIDPVREEMERKAVLEWVQTND